MIQKIFQLGQRISGWVPCTIGAIAQSVGVKASRSGEAANLMGVCACKMGDEGKAKRAASKLRGAKKDNVVKLCAKKGIEL